MHCRQRREGYIERMVLVIVITQRAAWVKLFHFSPAMFHFLLDACYKFHQTSLLVGRGLVTSFNCVIYSTPIEEVG